MRRTVAPVTTMSQRAVAEVIARVRKREGETSKRRIRAAAFVTTRRDQDLGVAVGAVEGRRAGTKVERAVRRVQQHGHHVRPAQLAEDPGRAVELTEGAGRVGANTGAAEDERDRVAGVDDLGGGGRAVVPRHADDRAVGRQVEQLGVELLDRPLLDPRVLRVARPRPSPSGGRRRRCRRRRAVRSRASSRPLRSAAESGVSGAAIVSRPTGGGDPTQESGLAR